MYTRHITLYYMFPSALSLSLPLLPTRVLPILSLRIITNDHPHRECELPSAIRTEPPSTVAPHLLPAHPAQHLLHLLPPLEQRLVLCDGEARVRDPREGRLERPNTRSKQGVQNERACIYKGSSIHAETKARAPGRR